MHEGLIRCPVTQVLRKGELIHGEPIRSGGGGLQTEKYDIS